MIQVIGHSIQIGQKEIGGRNACLTLECTCGKVFASSTVKIDEDLAQERSLVFALGREVASDHVEAIAQGRGGDQVSVAA